MWKQCLSGAGLVGQGELRNKRAVIVTHVDTSGSLTDLAEFLVEGFGEVLRIDHALFKGRRATVTITRYGNGVLVKQRKLTITRWLPDIFHWLFQIMVTFIASNAYGFHHLFIGVGGINGFWGPVLRWTGICRGPTVMYTIDLLAQRFANPILNRIYHWVDRFCMLKCDYIWNLDAEMQEQRRRVWGGDGLAKQMHVPISVRFSNFQGMEFSQKHRYRLCYFGSLAPRQGVALVVEALALARRTVPELELLVIGDGSSRSDLEEMATELEIENSVTFAGRVEPHRKAERMLMTCSLAVAMFVPEPGTFAYYTEPGKLKQYCAAGLPILMTNVPRVAAVIAERGAGVLLEFEVGALSDAMINMVSCPDRLRSAQEAAVEFAREYDWLRVYGGAIRQTLSSA